MRCTKACDVEGLQLCCSPTHVQHAVCAPLARALIMSLLNKLASLDTVRMLPGLQRPARQCGLHLPGLAAVRHLHRHQPRLCPRAHWTVSTWYGCSIGASASQCVASNCVMLLQRMAQLVDPRCPKRLRPEQQTCSLGCSLHVQGHRLAQPCLPTPPKLTTAL